MMVLIDWWIDSTTAKYEYDAQGYRVRKTINGDITNYLYEADKVVLETDAGNKQMPFRHMEATFCTVKSQLMEYQHSKAITISIMHMGMSLN